LSTSWGLFGRPEGAARPKTGRAALTKAEPDQIRLSGKTFTDSSRLYSPAMRALDVLHDRGEQAAVILE